MSWTAESRNLKLMRLAALEELVDLRAEDAGNEAERPDGPAPLHAPTGGMALLEALVIWRLLLECSPGSG